MEAIEKRERRKVAEVAPQSSDFVCPSCGHLCHFRIGLFSHTNVMAFMTEYGLLHAVSLCVQGPTTLREPKTNEKTLACKIKKLLRRRVDTTHTGKCC